MGGMFTALAPLQVAAGVLAALIFAPVVGAETVVSGNRDSNAPLIIDPSSDPDDPLVTGNPSSSQLVMFVQRMPVTKVVNRVTVGDLALGPGCSSGNANAKIEEYDNREIGGAGDIYYSTGAKPISTTPSKLTWDFAPIVFRKDRGYGVRVSVPGCPSLTQTTWAHNEAQVNPGQVSCAKGPQPWRRMWHESGQDDRAAGCVDRPAGQGSFDPSMPTGWLVSQVNSGAWDVRKFSTPSSPVCYTSNYPNTYEQFGAVPAYWRQSLAFPFNPEYTCRWTQWADWGEQPDHGWYYALPWLAERSGAPRDMYLKLDTADYGSLLESHAPILKYDSGETFHAISPGAITDFADPPSGGYSLSDAFVNILWDDSGNEIAAAGSPGPGNGPWPPTMVLGTLGANYWFGPGPEDQPAASSTDYINPRGDSASTYAADAASMEASSAYADKVYGRVAYGDEGKLWLQYWIFYYHNPIEVGEHEGDWEMIQVGLDSSNQPDVVAYSQHTGGQVCDWDQIELSGDRPVVYVAEGSHASYFGPDRIPLQHFYDHADGQGGTLASPDVEEITSASPSWVGWPGTWGNGGGSPDGPQFQSQKWADPTEWKSGLNSC